MHRASGRDKRTREHRTLTREHRARSQTHADTQTLGSPERGGERQAAHGDTRGVGSEGRTPGHRNLSDQNP